MFSRLFFRPSWLLALVYVGLVIGYGSIGPWASTTRTRVASRPGHDHVRLAAPLLRWLHLESARSIDAREPRRRGGGANDAKPTRAPAGLGHVAKWLLLVIPVSALGPVEHGGTDSPVDGC
ncbi:MAG: hypothetical protein CMJ83_20895 [Planctomycetes bacterium]|nr:hypothetical protein [Planctomycetota bacterium]